MKKKVLGMLLVFGLLFVGCSKNPVAPRQTFVKLIMVGTPSPLYTPNGNFHGYQGIVQNIGNKECESREWYFKVKMYDSNDVLLFDVVFAYENGSNNFPCVMPGQTANWYWSLFFPPPHTLHQNATKVDISKTMFQLVF